MENYKKTKPKNNAKEYQNKLNIIIKRYGFVLDEFNKSLELHYKDPEDDEYSSLHSSNKKNLDGVTSDSFELENNVNYDINKTNEDMKDFMEKIEQLKKQNRELKIKLSKMNNETNAADERSDEYKKIYEIRYVKNWAVLISVIIFFTVISKTFVVKKGNK
jgi:hypothetical protein